MSNVVSVVTFMCVSMHVCVCGGGADGLGLAE